MERGFKITELFAFIATEPDGTEGVTSVHTPALGNMPMVGADPARLDSLRPYAVEISRATGTEIVLAKFMPRVNVETIRPG